MLSRLYPRTGLQEALKCVAKSQVPRVFVATSSVSKTSNQRDLVNFPRPKQLEHSPPVVFGFVPKSWFDFFYPKTGVTGPYMLLFGSTVYMFSKEIIVVNPELCLGAMFVTSVTFIHMKYGNKIKEIIYKIHDEEVANLNSAQNMKKDELKQSIQMNEDYVRQIGGTLSYLPQAQRENVYLQMEAAYRSRIQEAYTNVKRMLDYQAERDEIERRVTQKNLVDWVIGNVEKSITPELKKNVLKQCIADLKTLTVRA
ncbi:UNVERIFIED_CONTAM: hypothetical protein PYX00_003388 [Menopon gallinae]|uniref:ATP synthase subunit b n=1 Tax=Menopon gallinae TaxID=328185 RepID=A0AAW2I1B6_9NEOP